MGTRGRTSRRPELPGSAVHFTRPPVVDGSRRECVAPPSTPTADATALSNGAPVHGDKEGRRWTVELSCGNHCVSWEYGGAHAAATCEGYTFDAPIFCGCVNGACAWFSQH